MIRPELDQSSSDLIFDERDRVSSEARWRLHDA